MSSAVNAAVNALTRCPSEGAAACPAHLSCLPPPQRSTAGVRRAPAKKKNVKGETPAKILSFPNEFQILPTRLNANAIVKTATGDR
jgi:hypothetical protein